MSSFYGLRIGEGKKQCDHFYFIHIKTEQHTKYLDYCFPLAVIRFGRIVLVSWNIVIANTYKIYRNCGSSMNTQSMHLFHVGGSNSRRSAVNRLNRFRAIRVLKPSMRNSVRNSSVDFHTAVKAEKNGTTQETQSE